MFASSLVLTLALAWAAPQAPASESPSDPVFKSALASIQDQEVPGADPGVLMEMTAELGVKVTKGMELARVDDSEAKAQLKVKQLDYEVAQQEADSEVEVEYAIASEQVQKQAYEKAAEANRKETKAISPIEVERLKLEWKKATAGVDKAKEKRLSDEKKAQAKKAEADASKVAADHRIIRAPFDGVVVKISKRVGEWIAPGEPIVQVVRIDRLLARGEIDPSKWGPADVEGRNVTVEVTLPRGKTRKLPGKIVFANPALVVGQLEVVAEFDAPMDKEGRPLVYAGLDANVTIHVSQPVSSAAHREPPRKTIQPASHEESISRKK